MGKERCDVPVGWTAPGELLFHSPALVLWQELCLREVRVLFQEEKFWGVMGGDCSVRRGHGFEAEMGPYSGTSCAGVGPGASRVRCTGTRAAVCEQGACDAQGLPDL